MYGGWGCVVEVLDVLVVEVCRDVRDPSSGKTKEFVFFVGDGASGWEWGGGEFGEMVDGKGPPFVEMA